MQKDQNVESELEKDLEKLNINDSKNIIYTKPSHHNMQSQEHNITSGQVKYNQQQLYRDYLKMQVCFILGNF